MNAKKHRISVAEYLTVLIDESEKTQRQSAEELGYENANIITMSNHAEWNACQTLLEHRNDIRVFIPQFSRNLPLSLFGFVNQNGYIFGDTDSVFFSIH